MKTTERLTQMLIDASRDAAVIWDDDTEVFYLKSRDLSKPLRLGKTEREAERSLHKVLDQDLCANCR